MQRKGGSPCRIRCPCERNRRSIPVCFASSYMWKETDDKVAVPIIEEAKQRYPLINQCSFDKGYYSKNNVIELNKHLDHVILPKKGHCNKDEKAWQESDIFGEARRRHSGVEACINNL